MRTRIGWIADVVAVTKDDGSTAAAATAALGDVARALRGASTQRKKHGAAWQPVAVKCSARTDKASVKNVWDNVLDFRAAVGGGGLDAPGHLTELGNSLLRRRRKQRVASTWDLARRDILLHQCRRHSLRILHSNVC